MDVNNNEGDDRIQVFETSYDLWSVLRNITDSGLQDECFYVCDLTELIHKYETWKNVMPRVDSHYAVKCNDSRMVLETLGSLNSGFDCASKEEISKIISLGVKPSRIIFANPTKLISHIKYAAEVGVYTMTFDNECELHKIKKFHPRAKLVLRIKYDDMTSHYVLGNKYGCNHETEAEDLLQTAKSLNLDVVGVSFHIGSGSKDPTMFPKAIAASRHVFDIAARLGFKFDLLDIGGGFPGVKGDDTIIKIGNIINQALEKYFPDQSIRIISEPGRYHVNSALTLVSKIHSMRSFTKTDSKTCQNRKTFEYYIDVSVFGALIPVIFKEFYSPKPLKSQPDSKVYTSKIWGPTCDTSDLISDGILLPEMNIGDWIVIEDAGAYTVSISCEFNGFPTPKIHGIVDKKGWMILTETSSLPMPKSKFVLGNDPKHFSTGLSSPNKFRTNYF